VLQSVEFKHRVAVEGTPRILSNNGLVVMSMQGVGVPAGSPYDGPAPTRAWIMLTEHASDKMVLIVPKFPRYDLSCSSVKAVRSQVPNIEDYVLNFLNSICHADAQDELSLDSTGKAGLMRTPRGR
jgi:hypothetical protein